MDRACPFLYLINLEQKSALLETYYYSRFGGDVIDNAGQIVDGLGTDISTCSG